MQESCKENSVFSNNSFCVGVLLSLAVCHTLLVPDLHSSDLLSMGVSCGFALFAVCCAHARRASDAGSAFSFRRVSEVCVHQYAMYTIYLRTLLEQKLEMILPRIYKRSILLKSQKMYLQIPDDFECGTTLWGKKCLEKQLIKIRMGRIDFFFFCGSASQKAPQRFAPCSCPSLKDQVSRAMMDGGCLQPVVGFAPRSNVLIEDRNLLPSVSP